MKHGFNLKKLNRTSSHRSSMLKNMATSLFKHESIKTTLPKAKVLRSYAEKLITKSRDKSLSTIRHLNSVIRDNEVVNKLLEDIGPRSLERKGGYTRIYKYGFRYGDSAPMAIIELVDKKDTTSLKTKEKTIKESSEVVSEKKNTTAAVEKQKHMKAERPEKGSSVKAKSVGNKPVIRKSLKGSSSKGG